MFRENSHLNGRCASEAAEVALVTVWLNCLPVQKTPMSTPAMNSLVS